MVWGGFTLAMALAAWGRGRMNVNPACEAFPGVGWRFPMSCVFMLARTLRDAHEALFETARREGRWPADPEASE